MLPSTTRGRRHIRLSLLPAIAIAVGALLAPVGGGGLGAGEAKADTVCGNRWYYAGIDVSFYQGDIDWGAVAASRRVSFGLARISDGLSYPDATFKTNYAAMRYQGITAGSYIFWEPAQDPVAQAKVVIDALNAVGFDVGDLPPAIDVEVTGGLSPETIAARLRTTVTTIQNGLGVTPFIYASPIGWGRIVNSADFGDLPLWVAHWGTPCPATTSGWPEWSLWQSSSAGSIPGIAGPVDLDQTSGPAMPVYTGAPALPRIPDVSVVAEGSAVVSYTARGVGFGGIGLQATCSPGPGTLFPLGTSTVTCISRNFFGATAGSFRVNVQLPAPPTFEQPLPVDISALAAGTSGTAVSWAPFTAIDHAGTRIPVSCLPGPGSLFPAGQSLVTCRATDSLGQQVTGSFRVSVGYRFDDVVPRATNAGGAAAAARRID